jgi:ubiquinone/menaquinone biosynthesis C-methylase UbiE
MTAGLKVTFLQGQVERLPFPDASFDVVAAVTVLCFVTDAAAAVREMARVLRPRGRLVLGELGRWSVWALSRRLRTWLGAATWQAAHFRTARELSALVRDAGLRVGCTRPRTM